MDKNLSCCAPCKTNAFLGFVAASHYDNRQVNNFAAPFQLFKDFLPTFTTTPDPFLVRQRAEKRALPPLTRWSGQCSNEPGALQGDRVILGGNPLLRRSVVDDLFGFAFFLT